MSLANLGEADLRGADLSFANLRGADLSLANLSEADLSFADIKETIFCETIMPDDTTNNSDCK